MIHAPRSDFWQVGIVPQPITSFLDPKTLPALQDRVVWLPDAGPWRYLADPFGLQRNGSTHVFVEAFDYRTKHAIIEHHELGPDLSWRGKQTVLTRTFHVSYPFIVEDVGEVFMIPECHRSGEITLFRANKFPGEWVREATLLAGVPGAEASVVRFDGRWWMFYTVVGKDARDQRELHAAYADKLTGPWHQHPLNPILDDRSGARPGGTPFVTRDGALILPVQDCSQTYGGALRLLWFTRLSPTEATITRLGNHITGDLFSAKYADGCHTLASCGNLTLIDAKKVTRSWTRHGINLQRNLGRLRYA